MLSLRLTLRALVKPSGSRSVYNVVSRGVAQPHTPPTVPKEQAPNYPTTWSEGQAARSDAMVGPLFEQTNMAFQPRPLAAIELIAQEPIRLVSDRTAACDGDGGALGHPKVFINLDKPGPHACHWCGIRFEKDDHHHHH